MPASPTANDLGDLLGFTLDELALNSNGVLSRRQRQLVRYRSIGYIVRGIGVFVMGAILTLSVGPLASSLPERVALRLVQIALAGIAVIWLHAAYRAWMPTVQHATGSLRRSGTARYPRLQIGGVTLRISYRRWNHLAGYDLAGIYRAYYGPEMTLFSVEPVELGETS